jgi:hypothetical protein
VALCRSAVCEKAKGNTGSTDPEHVLTGRIRIAVVLARLQQSVLGDVFRLRIDNYEDYGQYEDVIEFCAFE